MIERFIALTLVAAAMTGPTHAVGLPALTVQGRNLVGPNGKAVTLKGANLGNWLITEFWMFGYDLRGMPGDQWELEELLTKRFGEAEKDRLMDVYRASWITERDFDHLKSFGFNLVRLPMNYRLMEDDRRPMKLKPNAWKWIDRAVELAESRGMYVILDMHGAQGGQNGSDHSGRSNQNHLKDNESDQARLAWLWGEIAKRYRTRGAVVAYDVFNEPYGMPKEAQVSVFKRALVEIRRNDPEKLVYAHGHWDNFDHYGDPKSNGWRNVGFEMHYYPGLFGSGSPTLRTHAKHIERLATVATRLKELNVPFLVGEWNVVFDEAGGVEMMRRYQDIHAGYGWQSTIWSYKAYSPEGGIHPATWGTVVNQDPSRRLDFASATTAEIEAHFRGYATDRLQANAKLRQALTDPSFKPASLSGVIQRRVTAPKENLPGWMQVDVGGALTGGLKQLGAGRFELYGGGADIWGKKDQFRFLYRAQEGDFEASVTIDDVEAIDSYTKAGLMVRASLDADAPFVLLSLFPGGEAQFARRETKGTDAFAEPNLAAKLPGVGIRIVRQGTSIEGFVKQPDGSWKSAGKANISWPGRVLVGAVALSHDDSELARVIYRDLLIRDAK